MPLQRQATSRRTLNRNTVAITLRNAIGLGTNYAISLAGRVYGYRRRMRLMGGNWTARFNLSGTEEELKRFFLTKIGHHIEQTIGSIKAWDGFIFEMDYTAQGITRRVTMADIRNAVKVKYTDQNGKNQETSWYTDDSSIDRYGRIEEIIYMDGVITASAEAQAQTHLTQSAWPTYSIVSVRAGHDLKLEITAVGYVFTMNNRYVTAGDGSNQNLSVFLENIIDTDCDFVTKADIDSNTTQVRTAFDVDMRAWDAIVALTEIGDASQPYIVQVRNGQRINYKALVSKPTMFWRGRSLHSAAGTNLSLNPWAVEAGILRDLTWTRTGTNTSTFLDDLRDSVISEVETADDVEIPLLKTDRYDDSDFMTALAKEILADENAAGGFRTRGRAFL